MFTTPPPDAKVVAPVESNVETEVSPVTSKVLSKVTALSTFNMLITVVVYAADPMLTSPELDAKFVSPAESNA